MTKFLLLFLFTSCLLTAQENKYNREKFNTKNLRVTRDELQASTYPSDSTAKAFYIYKDGFSEIEDGRGYHLFTTYQAKIKILDKQGYGNANIIIPLYKGGSAEEKIHDLQATTYYLDGTAIRSTKLSETEVFREENEKRDYIKFIFPNLHPGAVLVYSCKLESQYIFNFHPWWFQEDIPKIYSCYETEIPANFDYNLVKIGEQELTQNDVDIKRNCFYGGQSQNAGDGIHTIYTMQDISAFVEEDYLTSKLNYMARLEYGLFDKMNLKDLLSEHTGNVTSLNVLLHNFYTNQDFEVYPVISATRDRGFPKKIVPVLSDFNYLFVVLKIEDEDFMLDATDPFVEFGQLPYRALNQYDRKLDFNEGNSCIPITTKGYSSISYRDRLEVLEDGSSSLKTIQNLTGYMATNAREIIKKSTDNNTLSKQLNHLGGAFKLTALNYEGDDDPEQALILNYELKTPSLKINDKIYLNPFTFLFFEQNPFKLEERKYPIDFGYKRAYSYSILLNFPETYEIDEIPEQKIIALPNKTGNLQYLTQTMGDQENMIRLEADFSEEMYASAYYPSLKELWIL